jgi:hypothetical protein
MMDRKNMNVIPNESIHNSVRSDDDFPKAWILNLRNDAAGFRKSEQSLNRTKESLDSSFGVMERSLLDKIANGLQS